MIEIERLGSEADLMRKDILLESTAAFNANPAAHEIRKMAYCQLIREEVLQNAALEQLFLASLGLCVFA